jgi:hypothetical protein
MFGSYFESAGVLVGAGASSGGDGSVGVSIESTPLGLSRYKYSV